MPSLNAAAPMKAPPLAQQSGVRAAVFRFWRRSYAPDWIAFLLLEAAYTVVRERSWTSSESLLTIPQINRFVLPFHRMFSLDDRSIQYPHAAVQRVPSFMNFVYAGIVPLGVIVLWAIFLRPGIHKSHVSILGLLISHALASFLTDVMKNAIGRPRPDLIDRCKPESGTPDYTLITFQVCTETDRHTLHDGWRSFPSGHSSFAFAGLGYLSLFFAGQMHVLRPHTDLARVLIALAPFLGAAMIAMSRMADYRHDVYDVACGSLLGLGLAYFSYRRFYPPLRSRRCDQPYPVSGAELPTSRMRKDEESQARSAEDFELDDFVDDDDDEMIDEEQRPLNSDGPSRSSQGKPGQEPG